MPWQSFSKRRGTSRRGFNTSRTLPVLVTLIKTLKTSCSHMRCLMMRTWVNPTTLFHSMVEVWWSTATLKRTQLAMAIASFFSPSIVVLLPPFFPNVFEGYQRNYHFSSSFSHVPFVLFPITCYLTCRVAYIQSPYSQGHAANP